MIHFIISYPILATLSRRAFITKGNANNGKNSPSRHFPALMTPFLVVLFINEYNTILNDVVYDYWQIGVYYIMMFALLLLCDFIDYLWLLVFINDY